MPRNGAGVYSLPESPFVDGTTISAAPVNNNYSDIATAMTGSVAADGQTPMTGGLVGTTAAFSGVVTAADGSVGDQLVNNSQFERNIAATGFLVVGPGALMLQWGFLATLSGSDVITFNQPFAALYSVTVSHVGNVAGGPVLSVAAYSLAQFTVQSTIFGVGHGCFWMAIGRRV